MHRLDKILANTGFGSRKEVKQAIKKGMVDVDGITVKDPAFQVDPDRQQITFQGEAIYYREFIYLMMNKPAGVISATHDPVETTVIDLLDDFHRHFSPFPAGRLDKDTEGLLLITNDGKLAHRLLSPSKHVPKTYFARVNGPLSVEEIDSFRTGIRLDDGYITLPAELSILQSGEESSDAKVTIYEGKYHQIKRMFAALGKKVLYLKRISMGDLSLDPAIDPGEYRELSPKELQSLLRE